MNNEIIFTNIDNESETMTVILDYTKYTYEELQYLLMLYIDRDYRSCIAKGIEYLFKDGATADFINNSIEFDEAIRMPSALLNLAAIFIGASEDRYSVEFDIKHGNEVYPYKLSILGESYYITELSRGKNISENEFLILSDYIINGQYKDAFRHVMLDHCIKQVEEGTVQELYGSYLFTPFLLHKRSNKIAKKKRKS